MKYIISLMLVVFTLFSAQIDTKLYDLTQNKTYFQEIDEQINQSAKLKSKSGDIISAEKGNLKRLEETSSIKIKLDAFDLTLLEKEKDLKNSILKALFYVSEIEVKQNKQNEISVDTQSKLSLLKKRIENIIEKEKDFLLSYQLQYAYYKIQKTNLEYSLKLFDNNKNIVLNTIIEIIEKKDSFVDEKAVKELDKIDENIKKILQQKAGYEIELEKEIIIGNEKTKEELQKEIQKVEKALQFNYLEKLNFLNDKILDSLVSKDNQSFLKLHEEVSILIPNLNTELMNIYLIQNTILKNISKKIFGNTKAFFGKSLFESKNYLDEIKSLFTSTIFVFNEQAISLLSIIKSLFLIVIGFLAGLFYKRWIFKISARWPNMSQMSLRLIANIGYYLIILITIMVSMSSLGIDMSSISLIAGALSIGIGFGLQTVVSNFIAGIILMFERTIRIGDIIEISDLLKGTVTDIRIRSTTIKTFDNIDIVIPNSSFIQNNVINWTLDDATRRLHIPFGVAYGTKIERVKEIILLELNNSELTYLKNVKDKEPDIRLENMNTSSVDFELLVWVKANDKFKPNSLKSDFLTLIYNALYKYEIEIPFPQLDLHLKKK
ncbi:mechanosensitive ion channel family protein [Arcobacter peruensis]|uniref:mechanosensitive ion channel family protein n=1 Tax=Arcobacter peruensis TaxID=2320140 RepID=UPI000F092210|nr:mechanosensitive ion channel domain-containing protein [Arcobacter peruensis]